VSNDLMIPDSEPYQISIHHIAVVHSNEGVGITDRGSRLGALLDGQQLGGNQGDPEPLFLNKPDGILVLGNLHSPYKFKLSVQSS